MSVKIKICFSSSNENLASRIYRLITTIYSNHQVDVQLINEPESRTILKETN